MSADTHLWFHPWRGAILLASPPRPTTWRYRGGQDADWQDLGVWPIAAGDTPEVPEGVPLPEGFRRGDAKRQRFGMGGPLTVLAPMLRRCTDCDADFVFTADEQAFWYEELGFTVDSVPIRCVPCRRVARRRAEANDAWAIADAHATAEPSPEAHAAAVEAARALIDAGGSVNPERVRFHARRSRAPR